MIDRIGRPDVPVRREVHAVRFAGEQVLVAPLANRRTVVVKNRKYGATRTMTTTVPLPSAATQVVVPPHSFGSFTPKSPFIV